MLILTQNGDAIVEKSRDYHISYFIRDKKDAVVTCRFSEGGEANSITLGVYGGAERARQIIKEMYARFDGADDPLRCKYEMPEE